MKAYLQGKSFRLDGKTERIENLWTKEVKAKVNLLWWQEKGFSYTKSGFGNKIPTAYMVKFNNRWQRVYCCQHSNSRTLYIGKFFKSSEIILVTIDNES